MRSIHILMITFLSISIFSNVNHAAKFDKYKLILNDLIHQHEQKVSTVVLNIDEYREHIRTIINLKIIAYQLANKKTNQPFKWNINI